MSRTRERIGIVGLAIVLSAPAAAGQTPARAPAPTTAPTTAPATANDLSNALESTTRQVSPAVVQIFTTSYKPGPGPIPQSSGLITTERGSGSGVIVDAQGYIVTNAHVVGGAQRLRVEIPTPAAGQSILTARSRTVNGRIVGIDLETDLAVIKVDEPNLPVLPLADSDDLRPGQIVLAFGSPLGLQNSVSLGVVSAVARQLEPESPMIYIQTDASINPGSSGGPLVDSRGRMVGINTLIFSKSGGNDGLGFAAPSNIVRSVYEQIRKNGRVRRGDIGVRVQTVTPVLAAGLRLPRDSGVVIADVMPGSPAARIGLRPGDLVLTVDGKPMENGRQLQVNLYRRFVGDVVTLEILREGRTTKEPVEITEHGDALAGLSASADPRQNLIPRLGILGVDLNPRLAESLPGVRGRAGVIVASTVADAIDSREGGLAAGDIVYAVNLTRVEGVSGLRVALDAMRPGDPVVVQIERRGELMYLAFTVE
jgi:serine protease Do